VDGMQIKAINHTKGVFALNLNPDALINVRSSSYESNPSLFAIHGLVGDS
jgi:hypothetical protein